MITQERAREIVEHAKQVTVCGPWVDNIAKVMTPEEDAEVRLHWSALPGDTSYMDAFNNILHGRTHEMG